MGDLERKVLPGIKTFWENTFCLAADLGQSQDPTAISVIQYRKATEVTWKGRKSPGPSEFHVRYLRRLPLGMSYVQQVREISSLLDRPPLIDGCEFVIDETGVGRPVGDLFALMHRRPTRVVITGGENQTRASARCYVPKSYLISLLDARLHTGELKIAADLAEASTLKEELRDFRRHISTAGRYSYEARVGKNDDLVLSLALAVWGCLGRSRSPTAQVGKTTYFKP